MHIVPKGGNYMKILLSAAVLFAIIHFIHKDLAEGTISLAMSVEPQDQCQVQETISIPIITAQGDTIESLFALYPDPTIGFIERLSSFYTLNPHLRLQNIVADEKIKLPLTQFRLGKCQ